MTAKQERFRNAEANMNREADAEMIERIISRLREAGIVLVHDVDDCRSILWEEVNGTLPFDPEEPATEEERGPRVLGRDGSGPDGDLSVSELGPVLPRARNLRPAREAEMEQVADLGAKIREALGDGIDEEES